MLPFDKGQDIDIDYGAYVGVLVNGGGSPIDPDVQENKYYAPGDGMILELILASGERVEPGGKGAF